jgi:hypothetical protein
MPKRLEYNDIKNFIIENKDELLSDTYINSHQKLYIKCHKCNFIYDMQFYNYKNGHRCPRCAIKYKVEKATTKYEEVKAYIEEHKYKLITNKNEYKNAGSKITVKCPNENHDPYEITFIKFKFGIRCRKCYDETIGNNSRYSYEYVKSFIENENYELLSTEYKNNGSLLQIKCNKGHRFKMRFGNFKNGGQRCPLCAHSSGRSTGEIDIENFIKTFYKGKILTSVYTIVKNPITNYWLEIDIYLPDINLAIEYNSYFHLKDDNVKYKDDLKKIECDKKGILLYIIWHDKWLKNKDDVYKELKGIISMFTI